MGQGEDFFLRPDDRRQVLALLLWADPDQPPSPQAPARSPQAPVFSGAEERAHGDDRKEAKQERDLTKERLSQSRVGCLLGKFNGTLQWTDLSGGNLTQLPLYIKTTLENDQLVINRRVTNTDGTTLTLVYSLRATEDARLFRGTCDIYPGGHAILQEVSGSSNLLVLYVVGSEGTTRMLTSITVNPIKGTQCQTVQQWSAAGILVSVGVAAELLPTDRIQDAGKMIR